MNSLFVISVVLCVIGSVILITSKSLITQCYSFVSILLGISGLFITLDAFIIAFFQFATLAGISGALLIKKSRVIKQVVIEHNFSLFGTKLAPLMGDFKTYLRGAMVALVFLGIFYKIISLVVNGISLNPMNKNSLSRVNNVIVLLFSEHLISLIALMFLLVSILILNPFKKKE